MTGGVENLSRETQEWQEEQRTRIIGKRNRKSQQKNHTKASRIDNKKLYNLAKQVMKVTGGRQT